MSFLLIAFNFREHFWIKWLLLFYFLYFLLGYAGLLSLLREELLLNFQSSGGIAPLVSDCGHRLLARGRLALLFLDFYSIDGFREAVLGITVILFGGFSQIWSLFLLLVHIYIDDDLWNDLMTIIIVDCIIFSHESVKISNAVHFLHLLLYFLNGIVNLAFIGGEIHSLWYSDWIVSFLNQLLFLDHL